jgi:hypothetical protein
MSDFASATTADGLVAATQALREAVLAQGGFVHPNVAFHNSDTQQTTDKGMGVFALAALTPSTVNSDRIAIKIPYQICISVEMILRNEVLAPIFRENPGLTDYPDEILCLGLMYARLNANAVNTEWSLHTHTLPTEFNTTLYWSDTELEELKDCNVYHLTRMLKQQIANDWAQIHEPITSEYKHLFPNASLDIYSWALSVVYSRAIGITRNNVYTRVITPCLDMANHDMSAGTEASDTIVYNPEEDNVCLLVTHDYAAGEEVFAVYGDYSNAKLAHTYGFVVGADKPHNITIDCWSKVTPSTTFANEKQHILQSHELTRTQIYDFNGTLRSGGYIAPALMTTVRVIQVCLRCKQLLRNVFRLLELSCSCTGFQRRNRQPCAFSKTYWSRSILIVLCCVCSQ